MEIIRDLNTLQYTWPIKNSAAAMVDGALLMPGVTADTDLGVLIVASGAGADTVGTLMGAIAATATNTLVAGTAWLTRNVVPAFNGVLIRAENDQTDTMAVVSNSSTTLTITSLEDNIDTSWIYAVGGTGVGKLSYLASSASGSATQKTAMAFDSTTTVIKILRLFHQLTKVTTAADKFGTDAAAGSFTCVVLQNWIKNTNRVFEVLDPTVHDNLSGLSATGLATKFYTDVCIRNTAAYTID